MRRRRRRQRAPLDLRIRMRRTRRPSCPRRRQSRCEICKKCLRSAALGSRIGDTSDAMSASLNVRFTLNARSFGGFTPITSYATRASPRRRTLARHADRRSRSSRSPPSASRNSIHIRPGKRQMRVAVSAQPVRGGSANHHNHHAARRAHPLHLGEAGVSAVRRSRSSAEQVTTRSAEAFGTGSASKKPSTMSSLSDASECTCGTRDVRASACAGSTATRCPAARQQVAW